MSSISRRAYTLLIYVAGRSAFGDTPLEQDELPSTAKTYPVTKNCRPFRPYLTRNFDLPADWETFVVGKKAAIQNSF
jgi:hypothetical protein